MHRLENRSATQAQIATELRLTVRQIKRLWKAYKLHGECGVISGHRTHRPNRQLESSLVARALEIVRDELSDFGPQFASEKLLERHGIRINRETLRQEMSKAGLWKAHPRRRRSHPPRERRPCFGDLVQIDGSPHAWFEERAPKCTLIVFIDDATSQLVSLHFSPGETTAAYFTAARTYFERYGLPNALYSDKYGVFRINLRDSESEITQFGRAMNELDIELICANSPQAKGRVERANRTLQDRLVKELRLEKISTIAAANDFLPRYMEIHNQRFAIPARDQRDAHRLIEQHTALDSILASRIARRLTKDMLFHHHNSIYQITSTSRRLAFPYARVDVIDCPNGSLRVEREGQALDFTFLCDKRTTPIVSTKSLNGHLDRRPIQPKNDPKKAHRPARNHPWQLEKDAAAKLAQIRS
ncbi:MAG: ISNCY family transposase [Candidatus Velthaea sp.]